MSVVMFLSALYPALASVVTVFVAIVLAYGFSVEPPNIKPFIGSAIVILLSIRAFYVPGFALIGIFLCFAAFVTHFSKPDKVIESDPADVVYVYGHVTLTIYIKSKVCKVQIAAKQVTDLGQLIEAQKDIERALLKLQECVDKDPSLSWLIEKVEVY